MKKNKLKFLAMLLILALMLSLMPSWNMMTANAAEASGEWIDHVTAPSLNTATSTYTITSAENLAWLARTVRYDMINFSGYTFEVTAATIDLSDHYWSVPIGCRYRAFEGTFYGNGCKITGLRIGNESSPDSDEVSNGLFGTAINAVIKNVILEDVEIYTASSEIRVGGLVGMIQGNTTLEGCTVSGYIECDLGDGSFSDDFVPIGGLIGCSYADTLTADKCRSACIIKTNGTVTTGYYSVGGFAGLIYLKANITNCFSTGAIISDAYYVGGFVGNTIFGNVSYKNCFSRSSIYGSSRFAGGFAGRSNLSIHSNNYASGSVRSQNPAGFVSSSEVGGDFSTCYFQEAAGISTTYGVLKTKAYLQSGSFNTELNNNANVIADAVDWELVSEKNGGYPKLVGVGTDTVYAPIVQNVAISGTEIEGHVFTASYDYYDPNSLDESGTVYQWYRADNADGSGAVQITSASALSYTVGADDIGKYLCCEVTPSNGTVAGTAERSSYTGEIQNFEANDASLSSLMVNGITVSGFSPDTYSYNVQLLMGTTSIPTVTAEASNINAGISITAADSTWGSAAVTVTSQDTTVTKEYTINFTVAVSTELSDLRVDSTTVSGFAVDVYSYNVVLPEGTTAIPEVTAVKKDENASMTITNAGSLPGSATVQVIAADNTQQTYTVYFTVTSSSDATLSNLTINGEAVNGFRSDIYSYDVVLPFGTTTPPALTATTSNSNATVQTASLANLLGYTRMELTVADGTADGMQITCVIANAASLPGSTTAQITMEDGTEHTYGISTTEALSLPGSTYISLTAPDSTLHTYSLTFTENSIQPATTTIILSDDTGIERTCSITDISSLLGSSTALVTAEDGITQLTYTVDNTVDSSSELNALSISSGVLSPTFTSAITEYTASVANSVSSVTVSPTLEDSNASVTVNGRSVSNGSASGNIGLSVGSNIISVVVTASDGIAASTYKITVTREAAAPDDDGGGGGTGTRTYYATVTQKSILETTLPVSVDSKKCAVVNTKDSTTDLFGKGSSTIVKVPDIPGVNDFTLKTSASNLDDAQQNAELTFSTPTGSITVPSNLLASDFKDEEAEITIGKGDLSGLSDEVKAAIADRPIIHLALSLDGVQTQWSNPEAHVIVSIPYTPTDEEMKNPEKIIIWYIDGSGNAVCVPIGLYNSETGTVSFVTTHFSKYAVNYNNEVNFTDVSGWYEDYVYCLAAREIVIGFGDGKFEPEESITRAQFIKILAKISGDDLGGYKISSFSDVSTSDWYFTFVQWAYEHGIAKGSKGYFKPNDYITRQDIAVMITRYTSMRAGYSLPKINDTEAFKDSSEIASYALDAVIAMQEAGIFSGYGDGSFAPTDNATRAEAAKIIALLLKGMIS